MRIRLTRVFLLALLVLAVVAACGGDDDDSDQPVLEPRTDASAPIIVEDGEPILVGVSAPITGPDSSVGVENRDAVVAAIERWKDEHGDQIMGHDIEVWAEDDGCTAADITESAATRLVSQAGLVGVLGPTCSAGAEAALPVYQTAGILAISGSATSTGLTAEQEPDGFFFRTAYRNDLQGTLIGLFAAAELSGESAYLIDDGEDYGQNLGDFAQRALEASDVTVTRESIDRGAVDFTDLVQEVSSSDAIFVGFAGFNPEAGLFYRQLRDVGYEGLFGAGDAAASIRDFVEPVGREEAEGVLFSGCPLELPEDVAANFEEVHGSAPEASGFVAQYIDAVTALLDAVSETAEEQDDGSLRIDPAALRDSVRGTDLAGVSGRVAFDSSGDRVPEPGVEASSVMGEAISAGDPGIFAALGLVSCEVRDGRLVNAGAADATSE